jgi:predicted NAD/FAD-dependent oxidoreductase
MNAPSNHESADVVIVGAGLCGLLAAARLLAHGASVVILDKGRSVGGRMATRRLDEGRADHGAQFFTVRNERFAEYVQAWREQNLVFQWSTGWSDGSLASAANADGHPRYAVREGMNALPKHLAAECRAAGATIGTDVKVVAIDCAGDRTGDRAGGRWRVVAEDGREWYGRSLVLTAPAPQSQALLRAGGVELPAEQEQALAAITYAPCVCAMIAVEGTVWLPAPGAVQRLHDDISWIADNQRKGISPGARVLTLHGAPAWSAAHYDEIDDDLVQHFRAALLPWMDGGDRLRAAEIKRWRYALPTILHPEPYLEAKGCPPLFFGGDGFGSARVEGAAVSGLAIGDALGAILA